MKQVGVISYNMSVFSAMGDIDKAFASEYSFFKDRAKVPVPMEPTDFFNNALNHLVEKTKEIGAKVIGIQEFHPPTLRIIMERLNNVNFASHTFSKEITNKAAVLTIWDKTLLGDKESTYDEDLGLTAGVEGLLPNDKGRPISIIKTTKGYVLINFHGINRPKYKPDGSDTGLDNSLILKNLISEHVKLAGLDKVNPKNIIMMCDSNDRGHGINKDEPMMINGGSFHDGHGKEGGAVSCCYNWDSCGIPVSKGKITLGTDGAEAKYAYTGDYVLFHDFNTPVTSVDSPLDKDGASEASDHKLVYAVINLPVAGGRRRKTRSKAKRIKKTHRRR